MAGLRRATGFIRSELAHRVNLRYTPELLFELDGSIARGAKISKLLNELEEKEGNGADEETDGQ